MRRGAEAAGDELPAVDPDTGRLLAEPPAPVDRPRRRRPPRSPRSRRLRVVATGLATVAVLCAALAAWSAATVAALGDVEGAWRTAVAVDAERLAAERRIAAAARPYGDPAEVAGRALRLLAVATNEHLHRLELRLGRRAVPDPGLDRLRDTMVAALRDHRADLGATGRPPGAERLPALDVALDRHLRRWRLPPRQPEGGPLLSAADEAVEVARRFADRPTGATLVGLASGANGGTSTLSAVDVDRGLIAGRRLEGPVDSLLAAENLALVSGGGTVTAHPVEPGLPPRWSAPGTAVAVSWPRAPVGGPRAAVVWARDHRGVRPLMAADGVDLGPPVPLDPAWAVGAAVGGLLVRHAPPAGPIELWDPVDDRVVHRLADGGLLVAASDRAAAWQLPTGRTLHVARLAVGGGGTAGAPATVTVEDERDLSLPPTDAGRGRFSPDGAYLAVPLGPVAGAISTMALLHLPSGRLRGLPTTAGDVDEASPAWSDSAEGQWLFWLSREGRLVAHAAGDRRSQVLRAPVGGLRAVEVVPGGGRVGG